MEAIMAIKVWNGTLEYKTGIIFQARITYDDFDEQIIVEEVVSTNFGEIANQINPFKINIFSVLRALMQKNK